MSSSIENHSGCLNHLSAHVPQAALVPKNDGYAARAGWEITTRQLELVNMSPECRKPQADAAKISSTG